MNKVTIKDIAKESGVSTATVSRVLSNKGYASSEIKEKVQEVARRLNYQPNAIARSLKTDRTNTIGVIIPDISNPYFMRISRGIEDVIQNIKCNLIFASCDENPDKERDLLQVFLEKRVDAIVIATSGGNDDFIYQTNKSGVPIVLVDRKLKKESKNIDSVYEDNIEGAYQLTQSILKKGHRRIGVINGSLRVSTGLERFQGYQKAIAEYDIVQDEQLIYNGNFTEIDGINAVNQFFNLKDKPTAIISFNNSMTFGAICELIQLGYHLPDDVIVASYGETEADKILKSPGIIYVKQSPYEIGAKVGNILIDRLENNINETTQEVFKPMIDVKRE